MFFLLVIFRGRVYDSCLFFLPFIYCPTRVHACSRKPIFALLFSANFVVLTERRMHYAIRTAVRYALARKKKGEKNENKEPATSSSESLGSQGLNASLGLVKLTRQRRQAGVEPT